MSALPYPAAPVLAQPSAAVPPAPQPSLPPARLPHRRPLADARAYSYPPPVPHVPWTATARCAAVLAAGYVRQLPAAVPAGLRPVASSVDNDRSGTGLPLLGTGGVR